MAAELKASEGAVRAGTAQARIDRVYSLKTESAPPPSTAEQHSWGGVIVPGQGFKATPFTRLRTAPLVQAGLCPAAI